MENYQNHLEEIEKKYVRDLLYQGISDQIDPFGTDKSIIVDPDFRPIPMDIADKWLLLLESLVFLIVAIFIFLMAWKVRKNIENLGSFQYIFSKKQQIPSIQQARDGIYFKIIFLDLLWITCFSRSLGAAVILGVTYTNQKYWLYLVMSSFPTLLFFTSFSLFIYFFAKIVTEEESDSTNLLKPFFIVFNAFTYVAFISIAIYNNGYIFYVNDQFLKAQCGLFGVVYLIFAVCMTNYGTRLSLILSNVLDHSENEDKVLLKPLNIRVIVITILLTLVFSVRACYNLLYTWGLIPIFYPASMNPLFWDCIFNFIYEMVPSLFILFIIFNDNQKHILGQGLFKIQEPEDDKSCDSEETYGNFNPNLNAHLLSDQRPNSNDSRNENNNQ